MHAVRKVLLALVAVTITAGALWYTNRTLPQKTATWEDVVAEARRGGYQLIRTEELWERYKNDPKNLLLHFQAAYDKQLLLKMLTQPYQLILICPAAQCELANYL